MSSPEDAGLITREHAAALAEFSRPEARSYAEVALHACLDALVPREVKGWSRGVGDTVFPAKRYVQVRSAWVEGDWSFCIEYTYPRFNGPLCLRRSVISTAYPGRFASMYGNDSVLPPDPISYGHDVAGGDVEQPLGTVVERLRRDSRGVSWWGSGSDTPRRLEPLTGPLDPEDQYQIRRQIADLDAQLIALDNAEEVDKLLASDEDVHTDVELLGLLLSVTVGQAEAVLLLHNLRFRPEERQRLLEYRDWVLTRASTAPN